MVLLCASVSSKDEKGFLQIIDGLESELVEIRADSLTNPDRDSVHSLLSKIRKIKDQQVILTVRSKDEGGGFKGTEEERLNTILGSLHIADMVDIELKAPIRDQVIQACKANGIRTIVSYHDYEKTPSLKGIIKLFEEEAGAGGDYLKVAFQANKKEDVLNLMNATWEMTDKAEVISICMGELGKVTRIMAPFFGSRITYASAGKETAPGQLSYEDTRGILQSLGLIK